MARNESRLVNALAYGGLRTVGTILQSFDVTHGMAALGAIGDLWYRRDQRRRRRAVENISRCFPEKSVEEVEELARRSMRHLLQLFAVEVLFTPRLITPTTWSRMMRFGRIDKALRILTGTGPAIFITGHNGNFELLGFSLATAGFPLVALARPLDLPRINDWLFDLRRKRGMTILTKFGAMEQLPKILGQGGRIAFIADQNAGDRGMFVPFFGRLASAYKSIGLLAMRFNAPIICGGARRARPDHFEYLVEADEVIYPEQWQGRPDPLYYITARYTRAIEQMVRKSPEQYFWVHRRWKSRPRHERLGRPIPSSLRANIESLPWMTSEEMQWIETNSEIDAARFADRARE